MRCLGWRFFFDSSWARFDLRFRGILDSLKRHGELVDKEANSIDIEEAREWRKKTLQDIKEREELTSSIQF